MRRSEERILTTHAGSLARNPELSALLIRQEHGKPVDPLSSTPRFARVPGTSSRASSKAASTSAATASRPAPAIRPTRPSA